jgi:ribosomal protein L37E
MNKLSEIFQAWVSAANPTPEQKLLAEQRTATCDTCEHRSYNKIFGDDTCGLCGCPLKKKVFSPAGPNACPGNKWVK